MNASGDSRAGSSFVNPEMFGSEIYREELLPANMPHSLDEAGHNMQQGDQHFVSPRGTRLLLADVDGQTSRASWKSSLGSEQNSRTASPSHRFSQVSRPASVLSSIGGEDVVTQGSRLSSMPLDSIQTYLPGSFQNEPNIESGGEAPFRTSLRRPMTETFSAEVSMSLSGADVSRDMMTERIHWPHDHQINFQGLVFSCQGFHLSAVRKCLL